MVLKFRALLVSCAALHVVSTCLGAAPPNGGFEEEFSHWKLEGPKSAATIRTKSARSGTLGLLVTGQKEGPGVKIRSRKMPFPGGKAGILSFAARKSRGSGCFVAIRFFDAQVRSLDVKEGFRFRLKISVDHRDWREYELFATAPAGAVSGEVLIETTAGEASKTEFDDFHFTLLPTKTPGGHPSR